jgi:hypothetical protein
LRVFRGADNSYRSGIKKKVDHLKMILENSIYGKSGKLQCSEHVNCPYL